MKFLKKQYKIIFATIHGVLFFIILWLLSNSSYTSRVDEEIMKKVNAVGNKIAGSNTHYEHDFVFVNVSRDIKLVSDPAEYGETPITDRSKLARCIAIARLAHNPKTLHQCSFGLI